MRKVLLLTTLLSLVLTSSLWAADVSGKWSLTMSSPQGQDETFDLDIKAAGENLAITCSNHPVLQTLEGSGTLKGDEIKMELKSTGETMAGVGIIFAGKVTGNKMAGTREIDTSGMGGGGQGGAPGGAGGGAPSGGQGGQAPGGAPSGGGQAPAGGQGGAPGGAAGGGAPGGGAPGGGQAGGEVSNAWTAVKK